VSARRRPLLQSARNATLFASEPTPMQNLRKVGCSREYRTIAPVIGLVTVFINSAANLTARARAQRGRSAPAPLAAPPNTRGFAAAPARHAFARSLALHSRTSCKHSAARTPRRAAY
jgi:hypothetical protein